MWQARMEAVKAGRDERTRLQEEEEEWEESVKAEVLQLLWVENAALQAELLQVRAGGGGGVGPEGYGWHACYLGGMGQEGGHARGQPLRQRPWHALRIAACARGSRPACVRACFTSRSQPQSLRSCYEHAAPAMTLPYQNVCMHS